MWPANCHISECAAFGGGFTQCEFASHPASVWVRVNPDSLHSCFSRCLRNRFEESPARLCHFRYSVLEGGSVCPGWLMKSADFADELKSGGVYFFGCGGSPRFSEHLDAAAHAFMIAQTGLRRVARPVRAPPAPPAWRRNRPSRLPGSAGDPPRMRPPSWR